MKHIYAPWRSDYLMKKQPSDCLFCDIAGDTADRENFVLQRHENWYIIVNRYPYTTGHVMIVVNRHVERFSDLTGPEGEALPGLIARCESALDMAYHPDGVNVGVNLGRSAGAGIVGHLHVHLVPRWQGDTNFMSSIGETRVISEDLNDTYVRLQRALENS